MRSNEALAEPRPTKRTALLLNGSSAGEAIKRAAVGGDAGALVAHRMDQQAEGLNAEIRRAIVTRVAEGIQVTFATGFLCDFASDAIRYEAGQMLRKLALSLQKFPNTEVLIVAHTDGLGDPSYNHELSTRRANSTFAFLAKEGVDVGRMRAWGMGQTEPVTSNWTESGRQSNRRVEVAIFESDD